MPEFDNSHEEFEHPENGHADAEPLPLNEETGYDLADAESEEDAASIADAEAVAVETVAEDTKHWYIIHTYSGFERKVAESLRTRNCTRLLYIPTSTTATTTRIRRKTRPNMGVSLGTFEGSISGSYRRINGTVAQRGRGRKRSEAAGSGRSWGRASGRHWHTRKSSAREPLPASRCLRVMARWV